MSALIYDAPLRWLSKSDSKCSSHSPCLEREVSLQQCATTKCKLTMHSKAVNLYDAWCEMIQFHECNVVAFVGAKFGAKVNEPN